MKIKSISIQNFRKLKSVSIEFSGETTVFVGANNSGKTSAMLALKYFLVEPNEFKVLDFTLSNWDGLNEIGRRWESPKSNDSIQLDDFLPLLPTLDIWFDVNEQDIHHVIPIIPTLNWKGGLLGIRVILQPRDLDQLQKNYLEARTTATNRANAKLREYPKTLSEFLEKNLHNHFSLQVYKLDPTKFDLESPQQLVKTSEPIREPSIIKRLIKVDFLDAQRVSDNDPICLSEQLRKYYDKHLNPTDKNLDINNKEHKSDINVLTTLETAEKKFGENLIEKFKAPFGELKELGYPNIDNPDILMIAKFTAREGITHDSAMQYRINSNNLEDELKLPETYSGLGYRNLISIIFRLMAYRDNWMRVGKEQMSNNEHIAPIHLVIVEEPEAHLHAQVQQVFIKKAYDRLRDHLHLKSNDKFSTHLLISTHSSHIAYETKFANLRYFKQRKISTNNKVPITEVINLTKTFGDDSDTERFVTRYLKLTHSDLFFADALIIVEGQAERILVPSFIANDPQFKKLTENYITLLELGGSHAHRIVPLLKILEITTLIIADLDSVDTKNNNKVIQPELSNSNILSSNSTFKILYKEKESIKTGDEKIERVSIDWLFALDDKSMTLSEYGNKVIFAYQIPSKSSSSDSKFLGEYIPRTFEDAFILKNIDIFKKSNIKNDDINALKNIQSCIEASTDLKSLNTAIFDLIHGELTTDQEGKEKRKKSTFDKAEFALELLFYDEFLPPDYIKEGLLSLVNELCGGKDE